MTFSGHVVDLTTTGVDYSLILNYYTIAGKLCQEAF